MRVARVTFLRVYSLIHSSYLFIFLPVIDSRPFAYVFASFSADLLINWFVHYLSVVDRFDILFFLG